VRVRIGCGMSLRVTAAIGRLTSTWLRLVVTVARCKQLAPKRPAQALFTRGRKERSFTQRSCAVLALSRRDYLYDNFLQD
jgi:hypothetical protein